MLRAARYVYLVLAGAFLVGVVVQVFLIGLGLFAGPENLALHVNVGWILHLAPILILLAAALARAGRRRSAARVLALDRRGARGLDAACHRLAARGVTRVAPVPPNQRSAA